MNKPGLVVQGITKSFDGNIVLRDFDLTVGPGVVHALLGHNGSGKSTFVKILSGFYLPDGGRGSVEVNGEEVRFGDPSSSDRAGLRFVHQALGVVGPLSVLENLHLGRPYTSGRMGHINWRTERRLAREALASFDADVDPDAKVDDLSIIERTQTAIVRALTDGAAISVLVLDEPTAALTEHEVRKLFQTVEAVRARGVAVIYVSHRLEEVGAIADEVTVLRDGGVVGRGPVSTFSVPRMVAMISGPDGDLSRSAVGQEVREPLGPSPSGPLVRLQNVYCGRLADFSMRVNPGEIVGVVGLVGSGLEDLSSLLAGRHRNYEGSVEMRGSEADIADTAKMMRSGLVNVMGERGDRVHLDLNLLENLSIPLRRRLFSRGHLQLKRLRRMAAAAVSDFNIRPGLLDEASQTLSGGNQQKLALARVMLTDPSVLVFEEPVRGVDAAGRTEINILLRKAAQKGNGVVIIDSDLDAVTESCDRILVIRGGALVAEFRGPSIKKTELLEACYG